MLSGRRTRGVVARRGPRPLGHLATRLVAAEAALAEARRRLAEEQAWRARTESELRLSQRLEAIGQLAAGIAHEINNPIQYVGDNLQFLHEGSDELFGLVTGLQQQLDHHPDPGAVAGLRALAAAVDVPYLTREFPAAVEMIQDGIGRIATIVRAMKELSHPGTNEQQPADLNRALRSALELTAATYRSFADVDSQLGELPPVTCYITELGQVFLNLIVNAAHAMEGRDRGVLGVATALDGRDVVITVSDTGGGIPADIQSRIFDPFFTTKPVGRGTGQGLAIARSIVIDRHGGALTFTTGAGRGTRFAIRIPVAGRAAAAAT